MILTRESFNGIMTQMEFLEQIMKLKSKDLLDYRFPRWDEFPPFELYIDQVIAFINEKLSVFILDGEPIITAAMINNYVKNGALHPPVKKKYNREHLAKLMVICIGKRMLSLADLREALAAMVRVFDLPEGYNTFCDELEYELYSTIAPEEYPPRTITESESRDIAVIRSLTSAVARILVFDRILSQRRRLSALASRLF